jgi:hypothetical protein
MLTVATLAMLPALAFAEPVGLSALLNPEGTRLFPQSVIFPRHPGKPDLRWRSFDWQYTDVKADKVEYRLFFYKEELWTAKFVIPKLKEQISYLTEKFGTTPKKRFAYLLFSSTHDFQQAHIFDISEGVQGITSTEEATMAIPYWGDAEAFRHVSTHEMTHQYQVQKMGELSGNASAQAFASVPLWFIEGMAEFYSLRGVDEESSMYIRDRVVSPPKEIKDAPVPFEDATMDFIHVYKMGQAKLDFLENEYGKGAVQKIFETAAKTASSGQRPFKEIAGAALSRPPEEFEKRWQEFLNKRYRAQAAMHTQDLSAFETITAAGETLDLYDISPDGSMIATREMDPLAGTTSIVLYDLRNGAKRSELITDREPGALTLYFMQSPVLSVGDSAIAYIVGNTEGPELEVRPLSRKSDGSINIGAGQRTRLHEHGFIHAAAPALSPDGKQVAFVGTDAQGWQNIYITSPGATQKPRAITSGYYSWQELRWTSRGIFASSDRTASGKFGIFRVDPASGGIVEASVGIRNRFAPEPVGETELFTSWFDGSSQLLELSNGRERILTDVKTGLFRPRVRDKYVYALGFQSGRYHLLRIKREQLIPPPKTELRGVVQKSSDPETPWVAPLDDLPSDQVKTYKPFFSSGVRIDGLGGYFSSGGVGGISGTISDLMRNYSLSAEFSVFGDIKLTNAYGFLTRQDGRTTWTMGAYHVVQSRLDEIYPDANASYIYREYGALGAIQYPLAAFSYLDCELRLAGVNRSDYSNGYYSSAWDAHNTGSQLLVAPMVRIGHDRIIYETYTGPLRGYGTLLEFDTSLYPTAKQTAERIRFDAAYYKQIVARTVLAFQGVAGVSLGGEFANPFFVSSDDILRAYSFSDYRLRGNYLLAGKTELRFPIGSMFKFFPLRGLLAYDIGTVTFNPSYAGRSVTSSYSAGLSLNVPPLALNFMLSYPVRVAPGPVDRPVVHFTLRYLYL